MRHKRDCWGPEGLLGFMLALLVSLLLILGAPSLSYIGPGAMNPRETYQVLHKQPTPKPRMQL